MFLLSFISSGLEYLSENHTSIYENSEKKAFKNTKYFGEYTRLLNHVDSHC